MSGDTTIHTLAQVAADYAQMRQLIDDQGHGRRCAVRMRKVCDCELAPYFAALARLHAAAQGIAQ